MTNIKKYFLLFLLLELFFSYAPAYAQTPNTATGFDYSNANVSPQIEKFLCSPNSTNGTNPLFQCINQLYKFAIVIASVVGVFFIVIAGYVYMSAEGNNESVDKAKSILTSTITALVILLAGYVLLKALNPDLVQFSSIQPPNVTLQVNAPSVTSGTTGGTGTGTTSTGSGCSGCVSLSSMGIPTQNGATMYATPAIAAELQSLKSQPSLSGINWYVTSAYRTTQTISSTDCHTQGMCADIGVNPQSAVNWSDVCIAASAAGFSQVLNEASSSATGCPAYQTYSTTDGPNIHVKQ